MSLPTASGKLRITLKTLGFLADLLRCHRQIALVAESLVEVIGGCKSQ